MTTESPERAGVQTQEFAGRTAVVSGGASGIGAAVTRILLEGGARVAVLDYAEDNLASFAASVPQHGDMLTTHRVDVSDATAVDSAVTAFAEFAGRIDIVIANAGIGGIGGVAEIADDGWRAVHAVVLDGVFHLCRAA